MGIEGCDRQWVKNRFLLEDHARPSRSDRDARGSLFSFHSPRGRGELRPRRARSPDWAHADAPPLNDPHFGDPSSTVGGKLFSSIKLQTRVGNLDQQEHIAGPWMSIRIVIGNGSQKHRVWLGLGLVVQSEQMLREHKPSASGGECEPTDEAPHHAAVKRTDR